MRDIVISNGTQTKNDKATSNNSSGTLTRGEYRSYRDFLESYGENKNTKDDQDSVSSTDSGISTYKLSESKSNNTSTSSLNSEVSCNSKNPKFETNTTRTGSFRNYMDTYPIKKFGSVNPKITPKRNLIKSEIVIQVNDPLEKAKCEYAVENINGVLQVEDSVDSSPNTLNFRIRKNSDNNFNRHRIEQPTILKQDTSVLTSSNHINTYESEINVTINKPTQNCCIPPPPPHNISNQPELNNFIPPPPPPPPQHLNGPSGGTTEKKWATIKSTEPNPTSNLSEKIAPNNAAAANLAKILTQHLLPRKKQLEELEANQEGGQNVLLKPVAANGHCHNVVQKPTHHSLSNQMLLEQPKLHPPKLPLTSPPVRCQKTEFHVIPKSNRVLSPEVQRRIAQIVSIEPEVVKIDHGVFQKSAPQTNGSITKVAINADPTSPPVRSLKIEFPTTSKSNRVLSPKVQKRIDQIISNVPEGVKIENGGFQKSSAGGNFNGDVDYSTTTVVPVNESTTKVTKDDPNVRKLVYNTYRGLLGAYNNKANDMIATLPRNMVREDRGITRQIESMAQTAAAPPPPPGASGHLPSAKLKSEISDRRVDPPLCVQNAMLTKDKKPFTYTPGGIDLSEIRSPRMARRLERNAMSEGVSPLAQTHPNYPTGPLPPSAIAAMQPQLPVQVFPTGGVHQPLHHVGGPPAPPPPPSCIPPPPKAPPMRATSPVPLNNFERPDMTKIIPENPMAMLRKTSGPIVKQDPILNKNYGVGANHVAETPQIRQQDLPQPKPNTTGVGSIYVPPVTQNTVPLERQAQSPHLAKQASFGNQTESSPVAVRSPPAYYKRQPSLLQTETPPSPVYIQQKRVISPPPQNEPAPPDSPKAMLSKAPTPWLTQRRQQQQHDMPEWAVNDNRGQPTTNQEQKTQDNQQTWQQQQLSPCQQPQDPPSWQQRPHREAEVQPWKQQQQDPQPWRQQQPQPPQRQPQVNPPQSPPMQFNQGGGGVRKQVQNRDLPQQPAPFDRTEVVIVNEPPQVHRHPGQTQRIIVRQGDPQQKNGARVIPVQMEGATSSNGHTSQHGYAQKFNSPSTPGSNSDARSLNRQLSWNSNPTQSNTFRVLQKITNTDGDDDDDEDQQVIEHSPKTHHQFPQRQVSTEPMRTQKQHDGNHDLFKQEMLLNDYFEYPRYRGGHVDVPSHLFWMLDESVPRMQQNNNRGPVVRTIPIQIEGDGPTKTYVPPSEQTVQEPKKYMGSSIPSRSFKILQAMTGPEDCAIPVQACENNENYSNEPSSYSHWGFNPNYPPPSPYFFDPYWNYYQNYSNNEPSQNTNSRMTPIPPNWGYPPSQYYNQSNVDSDSNSESTNNTNIPATWQNGPINKQKSNSRCTPVHFAPYYYLHQPYENTANTENKTQDNNDQKAYPQYPPYWDPYYYGYYYGPPPGMYPPPVYSPYPFYNTPQNDSEEVSDYSSNDEMAYYGARFASMPPFGNARPKSAVTPSLQQKLLEEITATAKKFQENRKIREVEKEESLIKPETEALDDDSSVASDSDTEMIGYEVCHQRNGLQTIPSVSDVKVYDSDETSLCSEEEEISEDVTEENEDLSSVYVDDVTIPHQLSVIFEESEHTDTTARCARESSVATTISEDTVTGENSEDEAVESDGTIFIKLPVTLKVSTQQKITSPVISEIESQVDIILEVPEDGLQNKDEELNLTAASKKVQEEDDVDWWGEISKNDDLPKPVKIVKEHHNGIAEMDRVNSEETKEIYKYNEISTNNRISSSSSSSEEDFWASIKKDQSETNLFKRATRLVNEDEIKVQNEITNVNFGKLSEVNKEMNTSSRENCIDDVIDYKTDEITATTGETKTEEELEVQEGMEEMQSVLTNIINTLDNRTKNCSDDEKSEEICSWERIGDTAENDVFQDVANSCKIENRSVCSRNSSSTSSETKDNSNCLEPSTANVNDSFEKTTNDTKEKLEKELKPLSVSERIKALKRSSFYEKTHQQESEVKITIKERISALEDNGTSLTIEKISKPRKNSLKSYEEFSEEEEEGDSGVTSDISRHVSETDTEPDFLDLKKITKYQRASTHSRLFKLLQDECDNSEDTSDEQDGKMQNRRELLNLPLSGTNPDPESFSSSGFTSPGSPTVNDRLVNELVQSLLRRKQGRIFKNIPMEKVQAAALRILQEDMDGLETLSSSEDGRCSVSPRKPGTESSTPAQTPKEFQGNYTEYSQYYDSWAEAERLCDGQCDILPSKAFRLIQEHVATNKTGAIAGLLARCPRVLSNKNVQKELMRLIEIQDSPSSSPEPPNRSPDANEVLNTS